MQQVADWLEKLGLGQYAPRFAENDIDFALLTKRTDADLKELGVTSLGHRNRFLEAIAERTTPAADSKAPDAAERRQVTVMFSDLVGSTALSTLWILRTYARSSQATVSPFGQNLRCFTGACGRRSSARRVMESALDLKEAKALLDELLDERATTEDTRTGLKSYSTSLCENRVNF
jgi:hypothetical protein